MILNRRPDSYTFFVGDRVVALENNGYGITANGWTGTVTELFDDCPEDMMVVSTNPFDRHLYRVEQRAFIYDEASYKCTNMDIMELYKGE